MKKPMEDLRDKGCFLEMRRVGNKELKALWSILT
jgi:hypothetical protein